MGYIVQKKEKGSPYWQTACKPGNTLTCTVPNLTEGQEYEFRVIAFNKIGNSEPSDISDSVVCRPRHCKYIIYIYTFFFEFRIKKINYD